MARKKCIDCEKNRDIKFFGVQRKYVSTKGKGISLHLYPCCKDCQYKRNRKSLLRSKENLKKWNEYQKKYNAKWQQENRNGTDWQKKYRSDGKSFKT